MSSGFEEVLRPQRPRGERAKVQGRRGVAVALWAGGWVEGAGADGVCLAFKNEEDRASFDESASITFQQVKNSTDGNRFDSASRVSVHAIDGLWSTVKVGYLLNRD